MKRHLLAAAVVLAILTCAGTAAASDLVWTAQTAASGTANVGVPAEQSFGSIQQGYVEASNVDPVAEITIAG